MMLLPFVQSNNYHIVDNIKTLVTSYYCLVVKKNNLKYFVSSSIKYRLSNQ